MSKLDVTVGCYRVVQTADGRLLAERDGMPWRNETGDNLVYQLAAALADARRKVEEKTSTAARLLEVITAHHGQKADDRCRFDDDALYEAAGLPPVDRGVGDKFAMLANCARFIDRRCDGGGPWKSYAELEADNARLAACVEAFTGDGGVSATLTPEQARESLARWHDGRDAESSADRTELLRLRQALRAAYEIRRHSGYQLDCFVHNSGLLRTMRDALGGRE